MKMNNKNIFIFLYLNLLNIKMHINRIYNKSKKIKNNDDYYTSGELTHGWINKKEPYVFTVTATNVAGDSPVSDVSTPDVVPYISPSISSFTVTSSVSNNLPIANASITVNNGGVNITSFTLSSGSTTLVIDLTKTSSSNTSGLNYTSLTSPSTGVGTSGTYTFIITGLSSGTTYTFNAIATNSSGPSASFSSSSITSTSVPGAPTNLIAVASDTRCTISFTAPNNGGSTITKYTAVSTPGGTVTDFTSAITSTGIGRVTIQGLTNGTAYTFTITATNALGTGPVSVPSNSVTPSGLPIAPTTITATSNANGQSVVTFSGGSGNGTPITGYTVTAKTGTMTPITVTGTSSPITVTGLTNGQQYTFNVTATNANGSTVSTVSATATPASKPDKISTITPAPGAKIVTLTFPQPNTNGTPITSYNINAYYTDTTTSPASTKVETINIPTSSSNYAIDSSNNVKITLYTKSSNAVFQTGSVITGATSPTSPTLSTSIQPYSYVPLVTYPIGSERENMFNCYNIGILLFILIFIVILWKCINKK